MSSTESEHSAYKTLRINAIVDESIVDGPGFRMTVFTQGCPHHCVGCHNPQTHDFAGGYNVRIEDILERFDDNPLLCGMTLSGGEPFCQSEALVPLAEAVKSRGKTVMAYSGYTYEQLLQLDDPFVRKLLCLCDILVDGPFILAQRNLELLFRGSENQRMLFLRDGKITHTC